MKKITITIAMAVLCLNFSLYAQEKAPTKTYQIGDKVPDIQLENILNHTTHQAKISDFKNKAILLDFWATWCGSCIKSFPKIDSLQKQFPKNLQVLLIDNSSRDNLEKIKTFLAKFKTEYPSFSLPLVTGNAATNTLYHSGSLPHYIWIGYDRKIKAITGPGEITHTNIERLVAGLPLDLPLKEGYHEQ
ncbi:TlpA family protein disulfide reductase [Pedobacter sp.]